MLFIIDIASNNENEYRINLNYLTDLNRYIKLTLKNN